MGYFLVNCLSLWVAFWYSVLHSFLLQVLTFGHGGRGKTGHGATTNIYKPTLVKALTTKVQHVSCRPYNKNNNHWLPIFHPLIFRCWRKGHGRLVRLLVTAVSYGRCFWDFGALGSVLASSSRSISLIISILLCCQCTETCSRVYSIQKNNIFGPKLYICILHFGGKCIMI